MQVSKEKRHGEHLDVAVGDAAVVRKHQRRDQLLQKATHCALWQAPILQAAQHEMLMTCVHVGWSSGGRSCVAVVGVTFVRSLQT